MKCNNCGADVANDAVFCTGCGQPVKSYGKGFVFACSLIGLLVGPLALVAWIMGQRGINAARRDGVKPSGLLTAGRTLGAVFSLLFCLGLLIGVISGAFGFNSYRSSAQTAACVSNLKSIALAYEQVSDAGNLVCSVSELCGSDYLPRMPRCPAGGEYFLKKVGNKTVPVCSHPGHELLNADNK